MDTWEVILLLALILGMLESFQKCDNSNLILAAASPGGPARV